ncbi:hypothetical protein GF420_15860, partial [candidate division GN15 bacterium]|nr:hypothetical protein [candidate division GN15 bacterium]
MGGRGDTSCGVSKSLGQSVLRPYHNHRPPTPGECMIIRSLTAFLVLLFFSADIGRAQEPAYLGSIPSDTINSLFGTEIIPLGDQNDDGYADLLVWDYRKVVQLYHGGVSVNSSPVTRLNQLSRTQSRIGDIDNDGYNDFASRNIVQTGDRLNVYRGRPLLDSIPDQWFWVDTLDGPHFLVLQANDINHNGSPELITQEISPFDASIVFYELAPYTQELVTHMFSPSETSITQRANAAPGDSVPDLVIGPEVSLQPYVAFGEKLAVGDFNDDGHPDLAASWRSSENDVRG